MHRFYLPTLDDLALTGAEAHHATHVLRLKTGDELTVFDGRGHAVACRIAEARRDRIRLTALQHSHSPPLRCRITLAQAIPKKNMEFIVQKATELGVSAIVPLISERTVARPTEASHKLDRWREIALESCKQCGNNWLPVILPPQQFAEFVQVPQHVELTLIAALHPDARPLKTILAEAPALPHATTPRILVMIGPEGDFTPAEYDLARVASAQPLSLGSLVMRADTAALYTLSILHHELQVAS